MEVTWAMPSQCYCMLLIRIVRSSTHAPFVAFGHSPLQPFGLLHYVPSPLVAVKGNGPGGFLPRKKTGLQTFIILMICHGFVFQATITRFNKLKLTNLNTHILATLDKLGQNHDLDLVKSKERI